MKPLTKTENAVAEMLMNGLTVEQIAGKYQLPQRRILKIMVRIRSKIKDHLFERTEKFR